MSDLTSIENFFSLETFPHRSLWEPGEFVWAPLHKIKTYLASLKLGEIQIDIPSGVHLEGKPFISIGEGTIIEPGVVIQGPCIIGKETIIRHGAYIRSETIIGDHCLIGHSAEIKHSILLNFAAATHFSYVGDSILGSGANLSAGVKCANLRLDRKEIKIRWGKEQFASGLKKFGAIVGDRCQIGCNCVLNPGTLVGKETVCYPLVSLSGYIPSHSLVKSSSSFEIEPLLKSTLEQIGR